MTYALQKSSCSFLPDINFGRPLMQLIYSHQITQKHISILNQKLSRSLDLYSNQMICTYVYLMPYVMYVLNCICIWISFLVLISILSFYQYYCQSFAVFYAQLCGVLFDFNCMMKQAKNSLILSSNLVKFNLYRRNDQVKSSDQVVKVY